MIETGVIDINGGESKTTIFLAPMDQPPGQRSRIIHAGLAAAEHLAYDNNTDVLLIIDNIYRFVQADAEIAIQLGKSLMNMGYSPTLNTDIGIVQDRIANTNHGSITSIQAVFIPADDFTDPAICIFEGHFGSKIILDRKIAAAGIFPAVDPLASNSKYATKEIIGERHFNLLQQSRIILTEYESLKSIIAFFGIEELSPQQILVVNRAKKILNFISQPLVTAANHSGIPGILVTLEETLNTIEKIVNGEYDYLSAAAFYMIGAEPVEDVLHTVKG